MIAEGESPVYCPRCGSIAQAGDRFCGVCGAPIPPNARDAAPTQEILRQVQVPPSVTTHRNNRMLAIVAGLAIVFVLALSVGAIFVLDLLGDETNTRDKAVTPPVDTQEKTTTSSLAEDSSASGYTVPYNEEAARAEAEVEQATRDYHEAVDREDWDYTYENLDSETREMFTEEEWYEKNQWFADQENLELEAIEVDAVMNFGGKEADVTVERTFEDGSSLTRRTYFVYEDGEWRHRFTDEEKGVFMPDASYEEFVAAQQ